MYKSIGPIILLALLASLLTSCGLSEYQSNGERIYFTAESSSGKPITRIGGFMMMNRIACVTCHGEDGKGGSVAMMMQTIDVPDITGHHLTEENLKRAITDGIGHNGESLDEFMPRWQMAEEDLNDLVEYIKTLE